jgi:hypothetical protein
MNKIRKFAPDAVVKSPQSSSPNLSLTSVKPNILKNIVCNIFAAAVFHAKAPAR